MTTAIEALEKGREFLKTHKWGRNNYHSYNGAYCAVGALYAAAYGEDYWEQDLEERQDKLDEFPYEAIRSAEHYLNRTTSMGSIVVFNDEEAKEKRDIIRKYGKAIQIAKRELG